MNNASLLIVKNKDSRL